MKPYANYKQAAGPAGPSPLASQGLTAGRNFASDLSNFNKYEAGSPEFNNWQKSKGYTPSHLAALGDINRHLHSTYSNPDSYGPNGTIPSAMDALTGQDQQNIRQYYAGNAGQATDNVPGQLATNGAGMFRNIPLVGPVVDTALRAGGTMVQDPNLYKGLATQGAGFGQYVPGVGPMVDATARLAGAAGNQHIQGLEGQWRDGFTKGVMEDSPYMQHLKAVGATGYMKNRVGNYFDGSMTGGFGKGIGSIIQWLIGLISKVPGYESIITPLLQKLAPNLYSSMSGMQQAPQPTQQQITGVQSSASLNPPEAK